MRNNNYQFLRNKWTKRHSDLQKTLAGKHKKSFEWLSKNSKHLAVGSLGGLVLLTTPIRNYPQGSESIFAKEIPNNINSSAFLVSDLSSVLPSFVRPLSLEEETKIGEILSRSFGIKVKNSIEGLRLNRTFGLIGAEQHLRRYPGDNMDSHFDGDQKNQDKYYSSGMAPGLGAWGYFATSSSQMTEEDSMREKYYIAVQTFLSPDFYEKVAVYRDFFKYRKMLVVNPENGKAIVAVIADAGPAEWTGKHLGGSPEVMKYLERVDGSMKGSVLYYFIDDANDTIPLGPVESIQTV